MFFVAALFALCCVCAFFVAAFYLWDDYVAAQDPRPPKVVLTDDDLDALRVYADSVPGSTVTLRLPQLDVTDDRVRFISDRWTFTAIDADGRTLHTAEGFTPRGIAVTHDDWPSLDDPAPALVSMYRIGRSPVSVTSHAVSGCERTITRL